MRKYRVKSLRRPEYDYQWDGFYSITICTKDRECVFGNVQNEIMGLSEVGCVVADEWQKTEKLRYYVTLDRWVVMPNHIHGIIRILREPVIDDAIYETKWNLCKITTGKLFNAMVETRRRRVSTAKTNKYPYIYWKPDSIGSIVNQFKSKCTKRLHAMGYSNFEWQRGFYDHIIRNNKSLYNIRSYIIRNPRMWERDRNNPECTPVS